MRTRNRPSCALTEAYRATATFLACSCTPSLGSGAEGPVQGGGGGPSSQRMTGEALHRWCAYTLFPAPLLRRRSRHLRIQRDQMGTNGRRRAGTHPARAESGARKVWTTAFPAMANGEMNPSRSTWRAALATAAKWARTRCYGGGDLRGCVFRAHPSHIVGRLRLPDEHLAPA